MIAQYRLYLEIAAAVVLLAGFAWFVHHERDLGEQRQIARDAIASAQQSAAVAKKEAADRKTLSAASQQYEAQIGELQNSLAARPASVVRVCKQSSSSTVRETTTVTSGPSPADPAGLGATDGRDNQQIDIGPDLDAYKRDAQALALRCDAILRAWPK